MTMAADADPRLDPPDDALLAASAGADPAIALGVRKPRTALLAAGFVLIAVMLFAVLNARRVEANDQNLVTRTAAGPSALMEPLPLPTPPDFPQSPLPGQIIPITNAPVPIQPLAGGGYGGPSSSYPVISTRPEVDIAARRRAPTMIVDLGQTGAIDKVVGVP